MIEGGGEWKGEYLGVVNVFEALCGILDRSKSLLKLNAFNISFRASCLSKDNSSDVFILRSMQSMSSFSSELNVPKKEK